MTPITFAPTASAGDIAMRHPGAIWRQQAIPVLFDDTTRKRLLVKLPYAADNYAWLRQGRHHRPEWLKAFRCWKIPRAWLEEVAILLCERHGQAYIIHPYRERETCAPVCWDAQGLLCECSCLGANHGQGQGSGAWYVVSDTCAVQWGPRRYACRLIQRRMP
jgi:hypothetical protein